ncbi:MAG TPA: hypothetical protein VH475_00845 [Tepidisphaeraceae bacterium]|jgi:hypothetical protein
MPLVMIKSDPRAREKPCLRCGYSLRKLDATHCPECGLSVWLSLNSNDSLDWSRPEWLRGMASALWLMAGAQLIGLVPYITSTMLWLGGASGHGGGRFMSVAMAAASVCAAVYLVTYHAGLVLLTRDERRYPDRLKGWRIASWVISAIAALVAFGMVASTLRPTTFLVWHLPLNGVLLASAIITLGYLRQIARRIPHSGLARLCAWIMLVPAIPLLKVFPFIGMWLIFEFAWLIEFLPVLYLPVSAVMFVRFAILLRRASESADQSWKSETAITR